jgi:hypothetical protein
MKLHRGLGLGLIILSLMIFVFISSARVEVHAEADWEAETNQTWFPFVPIVYPAPDPVLVGAGDIADCNRPGDEATADLLDSLDGIVIALGDNAYESGSDTEYTQCYHPNWGRHKSRTRPAVGNHDYMTANASAYFNYFGAAAGDPLEGYYSYDLGAWRVIVLNSNCEEVSCATGSAQEQWLRADLAAHPSACTLAYWHHPLFSTGLYTTNPSVQPFWQALYEFEADVVLNGHDHNYQRFAPQTPTGVADSAHGIREFVVGTGGKSHYPFFRPPGPNLEVRNSNSFGVLKLTLHPTSYTWQFIPIASDPFTDSGTAACH